MWEFEAIGTHWKITVPPALLAGEHAAIQKRVLLRIEEFDKDYSRFRSDSLVSEMSRNAGTYTLPNDAKPLLDLYQELYEVTGGVFTPLIGQVLSDAGYDANYSLMPITQPLTTPPAWGDVISYSFPDLTLASPALLDFGAAGKGYLIDIIADLLKSEGFHSFCINAGGDIRYESVISEVLKVGLEHPDNFEQIIGVASISSGSICGSAGNRRVWGKKREFNHIFNPHTLTPAQNIKAVWTTAPTARVADALSTCLFFMAPEELLERLSEVKDESGELKYAFEYLVLDNAYGFKKSPGFPAEVFTAY